MSDKTVIHIKVANEDEPGKYYLILSRGSSLFGAGGSITYSVDGIFAKEDSSGRAVFFAGYQGTPDNVVTIFPLTTNFTVVRKEQVNRMTTVDAATKQKEEEEELDKIFGKSLDSVDVASHDSAKGYL